MLSILTSKEDHVSMGGWSARKALKVIENVEMVRFPTMSFWNFRDDVVGRGH